jgi:hypothetical protein
MRLLILPLVYVYEPETVSLSDMHCGLVHILLWFHMIQFSLVQISSSFVCDDILISCTNNMALPILGSLMALCWAHESEVEPTQPASVKSRIQRDACWRQAVNPPLLHLLSDLMFIAEFYSLWRPSVSNS